ncbi:MAG: hydroxymethylbilane synthase [Pseudonocardia sp.]|nr:hydroxymethylbilane synthase [Pseudonocardia sp.]
MTGVATLRVGTRRSELARRQTALVTDALSVPVEIVPIVTAGDQSTAALDQIGGTGVFVSALRRALVRGDIDVAVHSYKDLPVAPADGVVIGAVPPRGDARDALVARNGKTLGELLPGARIGTGSPRRAAQVRALGLGLQIVPIRGNVDTRLRLVREGEVDAVILALAGLRRIGREDAVTEVLDPIQLLPEPAQGALAVEVRADDRAALAAVRDLDHADSRACVAAERAVLAGMQAGCSAPIGALGEIVEESDGSLALFLRASVTAADGSDALRLSSSGPATDPEGVGSRLAVDLIANGANTLMGTSS